MNKLVRILKHRWLDLSDTVRAVPDDMAERLARRVAASEARHCGEVRLCVEASLPLSYLWRITPPTTLAAVVRERALAWFGRLRIWDTEHNNGVLIYLLLAEHAIEFVADRSLARVVPPAEWQAIADRLGEQLRQGHFEDGLTQALEEVSALLVAHFPASPGSVRANELADNVVRR
ncbi:TPM domain-containing protein [Hydrogenophaga sp. BPS33]|uniref:TPM domain-containing protein n=1 Tax=Hydrogenophaga sp. BPS33 TaxID=2651974 RepID=UPI00131FD7C2|nr:TPM domain-containing protein [Hydrogenophaga sp. BPS33]QHE83845.1 TPM domain-containing protein [Hydrogenophaga sp. BPS33]